MSVGKMLMKRYQRFVDKAVAQHAENIRYNKLSILNGINAEIDSVPHAKEFWAKTKSFYSYKYPAGSIKRINEYDFTDDKGGCSMYTIWAYTDFRNRLLEELKLSPKNFYFKLDSQHIRDLPDGITEYYNTIMLVYKP